MNFYQMDVNEIERYMRNNSIGINDITQSLIDQLKEVSRNYEQITEVLNGWDYETDPVLLEEELHDLANEIARWKDESKELDKLQEENETLKNELKLLDDLTDFQHDEIDNLKHEISYLQNDLTVLKEDF